MENIVSCKHCEISFNYSPGPAGNARQLCDTCRKAADEEEVKALAEQTIIEKNKYLVGAPGRKNKYDPVDILLNGIMPVFQNCQEQFVCAVEIGRFVKSSGFAGNEKNLAALMILLDAPNKIILIKELTPQQLIIAENNSILNPAFKEASNTKNEYAEYEASPQTSNGFYKS